MSIVVESAQTADAAAACDHSQFRGPATGLDPRSFRHPLYRVLLTGEDLRLIQACSSWICRLQPDPPIRARFFHLEQQLARARPAQVSAGLDR
jgi:hypothetical protein